MLDAAAMPILMKAIDFLFEEGRKILQERRERRQAQSEGEQSEPSAPEPAAGEELAPDTETPPTDAIHSKRDLLEREVSQANWSASEAEVRHLVSLLDIQSRNYYLAKEQYAKWGSALVPQIIVHNLEEAENAVANTMGELRAALQAVYHKPINVPEIDTGR